MCNESREVQIELQCITIRRSTIEEPEKNFNL